MVLALSFVIELIILYFLEFGERKLKKIAPLRDPIEVKIKGYNLSLRKSEANLVVLKMD